MERCISSCTTYERRQSQAGELYHKSRRDDDDQGWKNWFQYQREQNCTKVSHEIYFFAWWNQGSESTNETDTLTVPAFSFYCLRKDNVWDPFPAWSHIVSQHKDEAQQIFYSLCNFRWEQNIWTIFSVAIRNDGKFPLSLKVEEQRTCLRCRR